MLNGPDNLMNAKILIVEDEAIIAEELRERLTRLGFQVVGIRDTGEGAIQAAEQLAPELILMDIRLKGELNGIAAAEHISKHLHVPVVYLTAHSDDATLKSAKETNPFGYLIKPFQERDLLVTIEISLHRHVLEQRLKASEQRYVATLASVGDAVIATDADGRITFLNRVAEAVTQWPLADALGTPVDQVCPFQSEATQTPKENPALEAMRLNQTVPLSEPTVVITRENEPVPVDGSAVPITLACGQLLGAVVSVRDIRRRREAEAERRKLEAQIQHAQKLESLGVLAGGIAHDFNNLLTGILGYADLAYLELPQHSTARPMISETIHLSRQAAELTKQMLAYSGKGKFVVKALDLNALVEDSAQLLQVSISKKSILRYNLAPDLPAIEADAVQMRQILMNLVINASDAIGDQSGAIAVTTGTMHCDRADLLEPHLGEDLIEGEYVFLEVTDTGCGMSDETRGKIFDPFYTTRAKGRGLGLSAVLGIVRGHQGTIQVISEPGTGTTFKVAFPVTDAPAVSESNERPDVKEWQGTGKVLVVDDEEAVRKLAQLMLEKMGFAVLTAVDGLEAIDVFRTHMEHIRLVLLDMTMPNMDGEETFQELRRIQSNVIAVLSSGYNEQSATSRFVGTGLAGFVQKPYRFETLMAEVRKVLE